MKLFLIGMFALIAAPMITASVAAKEVEVQMKSISYNPKVVEIAVGDSVKWKNISLTEHSATGDTFGDTFDTGMVKPKESSKGIVFSKAGSYTYHCQMHGVTMSGTVKVGSP